RDCAKRRPRCRSATACGKRRSRIDERNCGPSCGRLLQGPRRGLDTVMTGATAEATQRTRKVRRQATRMLRDTTMAAALITLALALAGCKTSAQDDPRTQPELVRVTTVAAPAGGSESFTGSVTARVQSDLGFRVSGKVIRR